jgi:3-hydroxybutyrate dehydrogenase
MNIADQHLTLKDKVALVTGAGSGIGRSIAGLFSEKGAHVLVNDVQSTGLQVAKETNGTFLQADLSNMEEVRDLARRALEVSGRVDILVNNAGLQHIAPVEEFSEEMWASIIQVMLIAPFQLTRHLIAGMKKQGWGRIINIDSIHGLVASPYKSAYVSAKHGLIGLTKTVALEAGPCGVTVNAICPAYVRTPLVEGQIKEQVATLGISEEEVVNKVMLEPAAIKRLVEPDEVAHLALFLASDEARSVTGAAYTMDLGWTAR